MKVREECIMCGEKIEGYQAEGSNKVWSKSVTAGDAGECVAVRAMLGGSVYGYSCTACRNDNEPVALLYGVGFDRIKKLVSLRLKPNPGDDSEASVLYKLTQADAVVLVEHLAEQGVIEFSASVSVEAGEFE